MKRFEDSAIGGRGVGERAFLVFFCGTVFHGCSVAWDLRSLVLAVPYFSRRDGQRRASAAWLVSSRPVLIQLVHLNS